MSHYTLRNPRTLRRLLWLDTSMGTTNAIAWLLLPGFWAGLLGLPHWLIIAIACVNAVYAASALSLAAQAQAPARYVYWLVLANWSWVVVSVGLLCWHFAGATVWGQVFLVTQVLGVGALAWAEGRQVLRG
jgi:hypothetical protein